jgi:hypothetical protein
VQPSPYWLFLFFFSLPCWHSSHQAIRHSSSQLAYALPRLLPSVEMEVVAARRFSASRDAITRIFRTQLELR